MSEGSEQPPPDQRKRRVGQRTSIPQSTVRRNLPNAPPTETSRSRSGSRIRVKKPPSTVTTAPRDDVRVYLAANADDTTSGAEVTKRRRSQVSSPDSPSHDSERRPPWKYQTLAAPPSPPQSIQPTPPLTLPSLQQRSQSQPSLSTSQPPLAEILLSQPSPLGSRQTSLMTMRPPSPQTSSRLLPSQREPPLSRQLSPLPLPSPSALPPPLPPPPTPLPPPTLPLSQPPQPLKTYSARVKGDTSQTGYKQPIGSVDQTTASWPRDSTSYAELASPTEAVSTSRPQSPQPGPSGLSYAAAVSIPQQARNSPPPTTTAISQPTAPRSTYPPLTVECLPNWTRHFEALREVLGHAPNARPLGKGVRFLPKSADEFRAVQRYLVQAASTDPTISWYCYSPETEKPTKVAIRGLPLDTPTEEIIAALQSLGFPAENARALPPPRGKHGCTYFVQLAHLTQEELRDLYAIVELLHMPDITVEAWRGGSKPPQCHRCQAYGHASTNCHRPQKCVRCAGDHPVRDCQRSRDDVPTCANCGQNHAANDRRCVHYKREARRRGIAIPPPPHRAHQRQPHQRREEAAPPPIAQPVPGAAHLTPTSQPNYPNQADDIRVETLRAPTSLAVPANPPTNRGQAPQRRKKRRNQTARTQHAEPTATSTPHPRQTREEGAIGRPSTIVPTQAPIQVPAPILTGRVATVPASIELPVQAPTRTPNTAHTGSGTTQEINQQVIHGTTQMPNERTGQIPTLRPSSQPAHRSGQATTQQSTQSSTSRPTQRPTHVPISVPPTTYHNQGEEQTSPDIMATVRAVMEALMTCFTAYMQGHGIIPAITAGTAVLLRHLSC